MIHGLKCVLQFTLSSLKEEMSCSAFRPCFFSKRMGTVAFTSSPVVYLVAPQKISRI